jgi:putative oxidoreductase
VTTKTIDIPATTTPTTPARALAARLLATHDDAGATLARVALALVMFPHGAQKVLGWFGGYGISGTMGFMTGSLGIPAPFAALAIFTEFFAPLALLVGLLARPAALGLAAIMGVAALTVHATHGFFMNWSGAQQGEGFEYHILAAALALVVVIAARARRRSTRGSRGDSASAAADRRRCRGSCAAPPAA